MRRRAIFVLTAVLLLSAEAANPQSDSGASSMTERGNLRVSGKETPYLIRRLPVSSFPELPAAIANRLEKLGCMIPQTYQAHHPENVIHGSFEHAESSDWAVLCSASGRVKLLVFFGHSGGPPTVLISESETARLETHDRSGDLGFGWGIDAASPTQVHEAQAATQRHAPLLDHDAVADSFLEKVTAYHYFSKNAWKVVFTTD